MDPQQFLADRIDSIKKLATGGTTLQSALTMFGPGSAPAKGVGLQMLRSAGKPNAGKMSLLGGNAPVYDAPVDEILDTPIRDLPGAGALLQVIR